MVEPRAQKLLVINQYYPPDLAATGQLAGALCSSLARRGFDVHVVTGQPSYTASAPQAPTSETLDGVHVYRVSLGKAIGRSPMRRRLAGHLRFLWGASWMVRRLLKSQEPDQVLTFHNPPFVGVIGAYLAWRNRLPYIYVLHDIHPDILVATKWIRLPRLAVWLWDRIHRRVLQSAEAVIVLGKGMKRTLVEDKGLPANRVRVIPPWAHPELAPASGAAIRRELGIADSELLVLYSGNMGIMHPMEPILDAAALLRGQPVRFLLVGDGAQRERLLDRVADEGMSQVNLLPFQSEGRFAEIVAASDACFVVLQSGLERFAVPSKAFTFLWYGRPLITIMAREADVAQIVAENACGWNVSSGQDLADLLRRLIGDREELARRGEAARRLYWKRFRRDIALEQYAMVVEGAVR